MFLFIKHTKKQFQNKFFSSGIFKSPCLFSDVNFSDAKNHLGKKQVDIGFGANKVLTDKIETSEIARLKIEVFTVDCLKLFESLTSKFVEESSLKYAVV